jgi:hypothetical protein
MRYTRPEITPIGAAATMVQGVGKMTHNPADNQPNSTRLTVSAYEADE